VYPITIIDNFFSDPDKVVEFASQQEYYRCADGSWPGKRTRPIHELDPNLFNYIGNRIYNTFYSNINQWFLEARFQLIDPFTEDQYDIRNQGWIHKDTPFYFGGIIFLNKEPDEDTGTSLYREKNGYSFQSKEYNSVKERFYLGQEVSDEEYAQAFHGINSQYEETVTVKNIYNRLLLFSSKDAHGVKTFGKSKKRLTISFFSQGSVSPPPPLYR